MATRKGGSLGWFVIGILVGAMVVAGVYFYSTRDRAMAPVPAAEPALPPGSGPPPIAGAPVEAPSAAAPAPQAAAPASGYREPSDEDRQIADDAAATGMTGPVSPPADQPTN